MYAHTQTVSKLHCKEDENNRQLTQKLQLVKAHEHIFYVSTIWEIQIKTRHHFIPIR